jgi:hypothetical protein
MCAGFVPGKRRSFRAKLHASGSSNPLGSGVNSNGPYMADHENASPLRGLSSTDAIRCIPKSAYTF